MVGEVSLLWCGVAGKGLELRGKRSALLEGEQGGMGRQLGERKGVRFRGRERGSEGEGKRMRHLLLTGTVTGWPVMFSAVVSDAAAQQQLKSSKAKLLCGVPKALKTLAKSAGAKEAKRQALRTAVATHSNAIEKADA
ncbi:hypothetical protein ERJ75_000340800 [Trypanosoma vivax]|nr:hypothetical protein ERJ75_000340800 [Trypanosoma vivax]